MDGLIAGLVRSGQVRLIDYYSWASCPDHPGLTDQKATYP
jgi:hypothetical protein